jgi:predicted  nucleic acid-binding Zn-ribbon protein
VQNEFAARVQYTPTPIATTSTSKTAQVPQQKWSYIINTLYNINANVKNVENQLEDIKDQVSKLDGIKEQVVDMNLKIDDIRPKKIKHYGGTECGH